MKGCIAYGTQAEKPALKTPARPFKKGEPEEIVLEGLKPNTRYFYQLELARAHSAEDSYHTARPPGSSFTSNTMRKRYFPNPVPDGFYTGDGMKHPEAGLLQDYLRRTTMPILIWVIDPERRCQTVWMLQAS